MALRVHAQPKFGRSLRAARSRAQRTQDEIAAAIGCRQELVSRWERDENTPSLHHAIALARHYRISLDVLLGIDPTQGN